MALVRWLTEYFVVGVLTRNNDISIADEYLLGANASN